MVRLMVVARNMYLHPHPVRNSDPGSRLRQPLVRPKIDEIFAWLPISLCVPLLFSRKSARISFSGGVMYGMLSVVP